MKLDKLCSGIFSDALDSIGYTDQVVTGWKSNIIPTRFMGRARTMKLQTMKTDDENIEMGLIFIGTIKKNEILLIEGSSEYAYFGEMMTRLSKRQGFEGVVIDGLTRDTIYTHTDKNIPILAKGYSPVDIKGRGRVEMVDAKIKIGKCEVEPGDFIFIDYDGVVVVPKEIEDKVFKLVSEVVLEEARIAKLIDDGITIEEMLKSVKAF